jgi:hypothetical protein
VNRFADIIREGLVEPLVSLEGAFHIAHEQIERAE